MVQDVVLGVTQQPLSGCWLRGERGEDSGSEGRRRVHTIDSTHVSATKRARRLEAWMKRSTLWMMERVGYLRSVCELIAMIR